MNIALFSDTYPPQINGVATATFTLAKVFESQGHNVLVITTSKEGQHHITYEEGVARIPGFTAKRLYNYKFANIYSKKVFDIIKAFKPDVIHVQTEVGIGIFGRIVSKQLGIPLVYTYHTMYEDYTYYVTKGFGPFDLFAKKVVASFSAMISDNTTEFTTTSDKTKEALRRYGVKKYINVIPNGINLSKFDADSIDMNKVDEIREKYHLKDKFTMLILGRLAKEKSNNVVISSLADYLDNHPDCNIHLLVVGDGPDKPNLEKQVEELKLSSKVTFVGPVPHEQVPYFYHASNLYVSASISETQGLTYNEAMASKVLVLARFDKNLEETIIDGQTGFFFTNLSNFESKLDYILNMKEEDRNKIIQDAYKRDFDRFSLELYYQRMLNVYYKAIKKYW